MGSESEVLNIEAKSITLKDLDEIIVNKNKLLKDHQYKFAVNESITDYNVEVTENDEIALLPPFSGG